MEMLRPKYLDKLSTTWKDKNFGQVSNQFTGGISPLGVRSTYNFSAAIMPFANCNFGDYPFSKSVSWSNGRLEDTHVIR